MMWAELRALWDERNHRYTTRRTRLTKAEFEGVVAYRQTEIALLPQEQRRLAWQELAAWKPTT